MAISDVLLEARDRLLKINERPIELDELVQKARLSTSEEFLYRQVDSYIADELIMEASATATKRDTTTSQILRYIRQNGIGSQVLRLTAVLNKTAMDDMQRVILATEGVYEWLLLKLLVQDNNAVSDVETLRQAILADLDDQPRAVFVQALAEDYVKQSRLNLDKHTWESFVAAVNQSSVPMGLNRTDDALSNLLEASERTGQFPQSIDDFVKRKVIQPTRFTQSVRDAMADYLEGLGLSASTLDPAKHEAFFVQAYNYAILNGASNGSVTPQYRVQPADSDFNLDTFSLAPEQGVIKENILAGSALHYLSVLGDGLGIFQLGRALILRRARGRLDLARGTAAAKLQAYKQYLRNSPVTLEERQLLAKRVFNYGDGRTLDDTVVNEEFTGLWDTLMKQIADYIRKTEQNSSDLEDKISRSPIDEAVRNLQYNLSFYAKDIADDVLEIKREFEMVKAILADPDIISAVGSTRRNDMWSLIERLSAEELHRNINVAAYRTIGVEGYKILQYAATFDVTTPDDLFRDFIKSGESFIIAKASLGDDVDHTAPSDDPDSDSDDFGSADRSEKEIDDWDK